MLLEYDIKGNSPLVQPEFPPSLSVSDDPEAYSDSYLRYQQAIENLTLIQGQGVTIFRGGPIDYSSKGVRDAWLTPAIIQGEGGPNDFMAVHFIHVHGNELSVFDPSRKIFFVPVSDSDLILENHANPHVEQMKQLLDGNDPTPRTIVRISTTGNSFYPYITDPSEIPPPEQIAERMNALMRVSGLSIPVTDEDIYRVAAQRREVVGRYDGFDLLQPDIVETDQGIFHHYGVRSQEDDWQHYDILSPVPLEHIDRNQPLFVRVDSGCDTGQCYHDEGCECRDQLKTAMAFAAQEGGIIVQCNAHNGRGYGLVTKLATEAGKRGIDIGYNKDMPPLGTIESARLLLGEEFDIRTYHGIAAIIRELGITDVRLHTDNRLKYDALERAGIRVQRSPTHTAEHVNGDRLRHIQDKHKYSRIYWNGDGEQTTL